MADEAYQAWLKKYGVRESNDYDTYAAFKAGLTPSENGHLPDTFKLPNHITYSTESTASQKKGAAPAGRWEGSDKDGWTFYASPTNIKNAGGVKELQEYFRSHEKGVKLILPEATPPSTPVSVPDNYRAGGRVRMI
jgi:hypothetical protein